MQIDQQRIIELVISSRDHDKTREAGDELPEQMDTDRGAGLLARLGLGP
jgi:hypothetical protein